MSNWTWQCILPVRLPNMLTLGAMPIFVPARPLTTLHCRLNKTVILLLPCIGIAFGLWEAKVCAAVRFGYVAGYSYAAAVLLALVLGVIGLPLLVYWRTRWVGAGVIAAGMLSCAAFYAGMTVLLREDRVAWRHEPPLEPLGPDVKASAVIYFRRGVTDKQIEDFNSSVLQAPARLGHVGRDYPPFVSSYLRLLPSQANGHEAIALTFFKEAPADKVNAYLGTIKADSRVGNVFLDIQPSAIHPVSAGP
jgi:hypothetical protein